MENKSPIELMANLEDTVFDINALVRSISKNRIIFFDTNAPRRPTFNPPELGFIKLISYLYILYNERGRINVKYLLGKLNAYLPHFQENARKHYKIVHDMRTYLQHNLLLNKEEDLDKEANCTEWFYCKVGTYLPETEVHWNKCLLEMLYESNKFIEKLKECIREIERDALDFKEELFDDWILRVNMDFPIYRLERIVSEVLFNIGRDGIDATKFTKKNYDKWKLKLSFLKMTADIEKEAHMVIEEELLKEFDKKKPITAQDIMDHFKISPGPEIGRLLKISYEIFEKEPCELQNLLIKLEKVRS